MKKSIYKFFKGTDTGQKVKGIFGPSGREPYDLRVDIEDGYLSIGSFYPYVLMQKAKIKKEDITDCTSLIDSVYIDWNYDGSVLRPTFWDISIPKGKKKRDVKGVYEIPKDASNIRIKVVDRTNSPAFLDIKETDYKNKSGKESY